MEIGTVGTEIASLVLRAEDAFHLRGGDHGAALPISHHMAIRLERDGLERLIEAESDENAHGIGAELDAGADLTQLRGLLVDRDRESALAQRDGGRQAAEPGSHHCDLLDLGHGLPGKNSRPSRHRSVLKAAAICLYRSIPCRPKMRQGSKNFDGVGMVVWQDEGYCDRAF